MTAQEILRAYILGTLYQAGYPVLCEELSYNEYVAWLDTFRGAKVS